MSIKYDLENSLPPDLIHNDQYHNNVLHHLINSIAMQFDRMALEIEFLRDRLDKAENELLQAQPLIDRAKTLEIHKLEDDDGP